MASSSEKVIVADGTVTGTCDWCLRPCTPRRCTRCARASYCSRECQRSHWKEGRHRLECDPPSAGATAAKGGRRPKTSAWAADAAAEELSRILSSCSVEEAHGDFGKARYELDRLRIEDKGRKEKAPPPRERAGSEGRRTADGGNVRRKSPPHVGVDRSASNDTDIITGNPSDAVESDGISLQSISLGAPRSDAVVGGSMAGPPFSNSFVPPKLPGRRGLGDYDDRWKFIVENLPNISCYSITITPKEPEGGVGNGTPLPKAELMRLRLEKIKEERPRHRGLRTRIRLTSEENVLADLEITGRIRCGGDGGGRPGRRVGRRGRGADRLRRR